jgi:hypothetical protein
MNELEPKRFNAVGRAAFTGIVNAAKVRDARGPYHAELQPFDFVR